MVGRSSAGFEELPHTADWSLRVWAADLAGLVAESARGMNALSGARPAVGPRTRRTYRAEAPDPESLLVGFLSELVYVAGQKRLVFDEFDVSLEPAPCAGGYSLQVEMSGAKMESLAKEIKAVTYHNLHIQRTLQGFEVEIVFDV